MTEDAAQYVVRPDADCPFCRVDRGRIEWSSPLALALWDAFPVSAGHALIVPRRHAVSWNDLSADEKAAILEGLDAIRALIEERHRPAGYNVGFNDGTAAGQTVMHFHLHVIPRYLGDVPDPRGGIRWVLGAKAVYWQDEPK